MSRHLNIHTPHLLGPSPHENLTISQTGSTFLWFTSVNWPLRCEITSAEICLRCSHVFNYHNISGAQLRLSNEVYFYSLHLRVDFLKLVLVNYLPSVLQQPLLKSLTMLIKGIGHNVDDYHITCHSKKIEYFVSSYFHCYFILKGKIISTLHNPSSLIEYILTVFSDFLINIQNLTSSATEK